jgi:hypothetical protein
MMHPLVMSDQVIEFHTEIVKQGHKFKIVWKHIPGGTCTFMKNKSASGFKALRDHLPLHLGGSAVDSFK